MSIHSIQSAFNLTERKIPIDPVTKEEMRDPVILKPCGHVMDSTTLENYGKSWIGRYCPIDRKKVEKVEKDDALASEIEILRLVPAEASLQCQEGLRLMELGKFEEASTYFIRSLRLNPDDENARTFLDFCLDQLSEPMKTIEKHTDVEALYNLGWMYERGIGTDKCYGSAIKLYSVAAERGFAKAQYKLVEMYANDKNLLTSFHMLEEKDIVALLSRAAKQGHGEAAFELGKRYEEGRGIHQSFIDALQLYSVAAGQGIGEAAYRIGKFYDDGLGVAKSGEKALEWYGKAIELGHGHAALSIAEMYDLGRNGVKQSDEEALLWYRKAESKGISRAREIASQMIKEGRGVAKEPAKNPITSVINSLFSKLVSTIDQ